MMLELERNLRKEEEEVAEKDMGTREQVEVAATEEIRRESGERRPVTRDREDRDMTKRDDSEVLETQGLKTSMHPNICTESTTYPAHESSKI